MGLRWKKERDTKMTIRQMLFEVMDNLEIFPKAWGTEASDYFKAVHDGKIRVEEHWLYELMIRKDYESPTPDTIICRSLEGAQAMMEEDIRTTLVKNEGEFDEKQMRRINPTHVIIGNDVEWIITTKQLFD